MMRNKTLTPYSQSLRRNMTKEERHLWYDFLKNLDVGFKRQKVVGKYILDFYCPSVRIAIELDGSQHYETEAMEKDREREEVLKQEGITVLRYTNLDIQRNFQAVCEDIRNKIQEYSKAGR
ncbi:MAG: endonuclease domain-containing protein [Lachnospiraceae bacterium]|nr:endonuclease domain-containing protein [Lachnospiraceae bacterium]